MMQYNHQNKNLNFLKGKIKDIKIAIFKSELGPELQLPNNIVQTLKIENDGTIWFFTSCNGNLVKNIDRSFYAQLSYYKKSTACHLQLRGKADLVKNYEDGIFSASNNPNENYGGLVLVKMKILQADFFENKFFATLSWAEKLRNSFNHFFLSPVHKIYNFAE
jgi:Pyridoxamine 5'-phosphate oxidase like